MPKAKTSGKADGSNMNKKRKFEEDIESSGTSINGQENLEESLEESPEESQDVTAEA